MADKTNTFVWLNGDGEQITLEVKERVPFSELVAIVELTVSEVFKEGKYRPYMKDIMLISAMLESYVDLHFDDPDDMMEAIETTDLSDVFDLVDFKQIDKIRNYVDEMVAKELSKSNLDRLCEYALTLAKSGAMLNVAESVAQTMDNHVAATPVVEIEADK